MKTKTSIIVVALTTALLALTGQARAGSSITNALLVHLTFDGNYNDTSGNSLNGTAQGAPTFVPGKIGQAVSVTTLKDSSEIDYVSLGYPAQLQFGTSQDLPYPSGAITQIRWTIRPSFQTRTGIAAAISGGEYLPRMAATSA